MGITPVKCIKHLIYETEDAIRQVENTSQQQAIRHLVAKNIQQIISKQNTSSSEHRTISQDKTSPT
jgi:ribosomal protein L19E